MAEAKRKYDIVIYGATGFTGGLVADYFARTVPLTTTKWAIAGRSQAKLDAVKNRLLGINKDCGGVDTITADTSNRASLEKMTADARIVITTVGPYVDYGEPLVAACIAKGAHYLDITGEPDFVNNMIKKYDAAAKKAGVYIINCCGFDSIPADAGAFFTARQLPENEEKAIRCFVDVKGRPSGGTWTSAIKAMAAGMPEGGLTHIIGSNGRLSEITESFHRNEELDVWALPMPVIDPSIVRRSSEVQSFYGENFQYGQFLSQPSLVAAAMLIGGFGLVFLGAQMAFTRNILLGFIKQGEGPSEEARNEGSFELTFLGESENKSVIAKVSGGDPGYTETSKMVSESALVIAKHEDKLTLGGGVCTPAGALGDMLIERLQSAGINFRTVRNY